MPYLPTSQAFLEQSALLLEAYPETTRITTKYSFPSERPGEQNKRQKSQIKKKTENNTAAAADNSVTSAADTTTISGNGAASTAAPTAPIAVLTLKTFNPTAGICLKYRTNKGAEVGRLMTGLGKLAAGADVASLGLSGPATATATAASADVDMVDAPPAPEENVGSQGKSQGPGGGGKGKKKGGKGKR